MFNNIEKIHPLFDSIKIILHVFLRIRPVIEFTFEILSELQITLTSLILSHSPEILVRKGIKDTGLSMTGSLLEVLSFPEELPSS